MEKALEKELLALENRYWQAIKDQNIDAALELTADPCIVTGAQGVASIDRATFMKMMRASPWSLQEFTLSDAKVARLSPDVAIIAYKVREKVTVDGKPMELEAADASTWVRKDGKWVCALHTESVAGDPFGRSRTKH